ncbi:hypothetical protein [Cellulomonas iranensis]|uniref:DUF4365 domain-containing protein n=1 Tax=Cellulomonas iranensis TaxID=76862 RepID=A0ABU0GGS7_9CELL|nr:hypothetical protein [Cellulomonas iranensis]MDQ0424561.1 hypothetical protein [Cellulomonas iranensis]
MRSIPEKTLEHWTSLYATYRYRSHAALWWPTRGEDVRVGDIAPGLFGKMFNLEIKTTEASGTDHHAYVDVAQLRRYLASPVPTYYVFPLPGWVGPIHLAAAGPWRGGVPKTEFGFMRSHGRWFGNWTIVIPDYALYAPIAYADAHGDPVKDHERVFTVDTTSAGAPRRQRGLYAAPSSSKLTSWSWREFWELMEVCGGSSAMPAMFAVSGGGGDGPVHRSALVAKIAAVARLEEATSPVFYAPADRQAVPTLDQEYAPIAATSVAVSGERVRDGADDRHDSHLTSVYLSAAQIASARAS